MNNQPTTDQQSERKRRWHQTRVLVERQVQDCEEKEELSDFSDVEKLVRLKRDHKFIVEDRRYIGTVSAAAWHRQKFRGDWH